MTPRINLFDWLGECTGETIWSEQYARSRQIPLQWIDELADAFESGFQNDAQTIYVGDRIVGHYRGIRDVDLAKRIASELGLDVIAIEARSLSRSHLVQNIKDALEED